MIRPFILSFCAQLFLVGGGLAMDPVGEMKSFSAFSKFEIPSSSLDKIWTDTGSEMKFSRGLSAQACFLVMAPAEKTAQLFQTYDGSSHDLLKIYSHLPIHSPISDRDLASLDLLKGNPFFKKLAARTLAIEKERMGLNLNQAEVARILEILKPGDDPSGAILRCWREILKARANSFQRKGLEGMPPYEDGKMEIPVESEIQSLLREEPGVEKQFSPFLSTTLLAKNPSSKDGPYQYLEFLDVDSRPNFNLGATWLGKMEGRYQAVDCVYYSSGGFYVTCNLCQVWPIKIGEKTVSLVWQEEFVSSPSIADLKGMDAMAARGVMIQQLKKEIRAFREDLEKTP